MTNSSKAIVTALTSILLSACDFQSVAVGEWEVSYDDRDNASDEIWEITRDETLIMNDGETELVIPVDLSGSRMSWVFDAEDENSASFAGSVNGNRFAGTLFSQQGNRSIYGVRRRTD